MARRLAATRHGVCTPLRRTTPSRQESAVRTLRLALRRDVRAMCVGFSIGDAIFFALAGLASYSKPFTELPVLSVLVVTVSMTAPMTAWMFYRGMPRRIVTEMSAAMPILAF